jgi:hypothetical protein
VDTLDCIDKEAIAIAVVEKVFQSAKVNGNDKEVLRLMRRILALTALPPDERLQEMAKVVLGKNASQSGLDEWCAGLRDDCYAAITRAREARTEQKRVWHVAVDGVSPAGHGIYEAPARGYYVTIGKEGDKPMFAWFTRDWTRALELILSDKREGAQSTGVGCEAEGSYRIRLWLRDGAEYWGKICSVEWGHKFL